VNVRVIGLALENVLDKSKKFPSIATPLSSTENDPKPAPLAVTSVITAEADALVIAPPTSMANINVLNVPFILLSPLKFDGVARYGSTGLVPRIIMVQQALLFR
jgi:hypothetical protein